MRGDVNQISFVGCSNLSYFHPIVEPHAMDKDSFLDLLKGKAAKVKEAKAVEVC